MYIRCRRAVASPRDISILKRCACIGSTIKGIQANRILSTEILHPSSHTSFTPFHPLFLRWLERVEFSCSNVHASRKRILGFLASPRCTAGVSRRELRSAPLFSFSLLLPRGAVSPYIYLIAPRTTRVRALSRSLPTTHPFATALAYSRSRALCASIIRAVSLPALACPRNN